MERSKEAARTTSYVGVTGSRVTYDGGTSLIAREVRKGESVLELRDEQGKPLWRSQPR